MEAAARSITALCNAKVDLSLDTSRSYVHRASEQRGESRGTQWTGTPHVFRGEEAWAIRGLLHPDWKEFVELQPCLLLALLVVTAQVPALLAAT